MSSHTIRAAARSLLATLLLFLAGSGFAQLTVSPQTDLQQLARTITGPGVIISNPNIQCHNRGYGQFQYQGSLLGIDEGILLTTGTIDNAVGPNNVEDRSFNQQRSGNAVLNTVTGRTTYDACLFEFDVIPGGDSLRFDFVFASEEYNEWVGSQFNDVFGFFISGPGIDGDPEIGNEKNIALIPGTEQAVAINNVNNGSNSDHYHDNAGGQHIQYDGLTTGLSAFSAVEPCQTYHLKLVVADASDRIYDSGVFIAKVKSNPVSMELFTENGGDTLIEGCNDGYVRFTRQVVDDQDLTLEYYLHGTATNGVDYADIGQPDNNVPKTITIPANQAYVDQAINVVADGVPEGLETMLFILGNPYCPATYADTLLVPVVDSLFATAGPAISTICKGGEVALYATGGTSYSWTPAEGLSSTTISNPAAAPAATTQYTVTVAHGNCTKTLHAEVKVSDLTIQGAITKPLCHGDATGIINLSVTNGIPPYAFAWTGPNGFSANTEDIAYLTAGTYTVTATDAACTRTQSFNVGQPAPLTVGLTPSLLVFGQNISCHGGDDGYINTTITGGTGPYTASWTGTNGFTSHAINLSGLSAATYHVTITDVNGCTATASVTLEDSGPMAAEITEAHDVQCVGDGSGSATVSVFGGMPLYNYAWNTTPVQTTASATGLLPGSYTVTVTDQYGCEIQASTTINGPTQPLSVQLKSKNDLTCHGAANGSAAITMSGGMPGYSVVWNTTPPQTGTVANGLSGGTYTATVTDANGCQATRQVTIAEPAEALAITITAQENIHCHGQSTGLATVNASGGTGPYSYSWNTTPPRSGASVSGLPAGTWAVTATDIKGCTTTLDVTITAPMQPLTATISASTPATCAGSNNGQATVSPSGGTPPYSFVWNTTPVQSTATATDLPPGTWQVTIGDAQGCSTTASVVITQPAPLTLSGTVVPAQCQGTNNGAVDLATAGGAGSYSWAWTGPGGYTADTEDIQGIPAGGYTVIVTDANGCTATRSFDVNQPGLFEVSSEPSIFGTANVTCPTSNDGAIDLTVSGAVAPYTYAWTGPNGFTFGNEDPSGLIAGSYHVSITDANGCSTSHDITLSAPEPVAIQLNPSNHGGTAISCNNGNDGAITAIITGGTGPYNTTWAGPNGFTSSAQDPIGLTVGTYTLTVLDDHQCEAVQQITLTQPLPLAASTGGTSPVTCFGSQTGQATVQIAGGREPYSLIWNTTPPQYGTTATGLAAGNHTVQVADANGCTTSTMITVGGPTALLEVSTNTISPVLCHGGNNGEAMVSASGGTGPYTFAWNTDPVQTGPHATGLPAGSWTVTVTDAAGCQTVKTIVIGQPLQALEAQLSHVNEVSCHGDNNGGASIQVSGGSGNYNITWSTVPVQTGSTVSGLGIGNYTATITDANGCAQPLILPVTINGPVAPLQVTAVPFAYPGGAHVSCPGLADGSIHANVSGGTPGYHFFWQDGSGITFHGQDPAGLAAGNYLLDVVDAHGCAASTSVELVPPTPIQADVDVQSALCHGESTGAIDLSITGGSGPYSYEWSGPNAFFSDAQDLSMIAAGVYTVLTTDANGCSMQQPVDVTEPGTFTFTPSIEAVSCHDATDGAITVVANGGTTPYTYDWTGPNGFSSGGPSINELAGGTYHLILTDDNGCQALFSTALQAPSALTVYTFPIKGPGGYEVSCAGGSNGQIGAVVAGGTEPYVISWAGPGGYTASQLNIDQLTAGDYTLTITDANGCSVVASTSLAAPPVLTATTTNSAFAGGFNISCDGAQDGAIVLTPSGGTQPYEVVWTNPDGSNSTDWHITGLVPGNYSAQITDMNDCSVTVDAVLVAPQPLVLTPTVTDIVCHGAAAGEVDLGVSGGSGTYTFQWSGPGVFTAATSGISGVIAGTYEVIVTDANGCTATASTDVSQALPITATGTLTTTACQGANTGAVSLDVSGGTGGYTYAWTGYPAFSANTADITDLFAGVYTVTITDAAGCSITTSYNVGEPDLFVISAELSQVAGGYHVSCAGATDGTIDATVSGGTGPYSYYWTGPGGFTAIGAQLTGLAPGPYLLTVHDVNGCNAGANFTLVAPQPLQVGLTPTAMPGCSDSGNGSIATGITGGVAPYTTEWTGPDGSLGIDPNPTGLAAGTYEVEVTDAVGCTAVAAITLVAPAAIDALATADVLPNGNNLSCASSSDGHIDLAITGGTGPYQVGWTGPNGFTANGIALNGLGEGLYTALITDAHGCTATAQVELTGPDELQVAVSAATYSNGNNVSCAGAADGSLWVNVLGGIPDYEIFWSGPNGFSSQADTLTDLGPGNYQVTIIDAAGCNAHASAVLQAPTPITIGAVLSEHDGFEVGCDGQDGSISLLVSGGLGPYQYAWTGPNGFASTDPDLDELGAGTYTVDVSDANGCTTSRSFTLNAPENLQLNLAVTSNECDVDSNGEINLTINGGMAPFEVLWSGPNGFASTDEDLNGLASGTYQVTVTSAMGCITHAQANVIAAAPMDLTLYASQYGDVNIACHGAATGTIELHVAGGFQPLDIHWEGPVGYVAGTANINGLAAGFYQATITDAHGCVRDTSITLVEPDSPLITTIHSVDVPCFGGATGSINTTVTGGAAPYTFSWRGPDSAYFSTSDITDLIAGDYELVVMDANQCMNTLQATLSGPASALSLVHEVVDRNGVNISCAGQADGTINLTAEGGTPGYSYSWSGPDTFTSSADSLSGLAAGSYTVVVTDDNGCEAQADFTLIAAAAITIEINATTLPSGSMISCHGAGDGAVGSVIGGGTGTLSGQWNGPDGFISNATNLADLPPGMYCLTVQDENDCTAEACITISEPDPLHAAATTTDAPCGLASGTVDATISGGTAPYIFDWNNGADSEDLAQVPTGDYLLLVTDANGCTTTATATVDGTPAVDAVPEIDMPLCHDSDEGRINLEVISGTAPFSFNWENGSTGDLLGGLMIGEYAVTITDANGCTWAETITVPGPDALDVEAEPSQYGGGHNVSAWGAHNGSIVVHVAGGTPAYSYDWENGSSGDARYGLSAGTYLVTVTDANGCSAELSIILTEPDDLAMPTGFTPNGDGDNDIFIVRGIEGWPNNQITVFNRWGNVVFDQLNYRNDWRGENMQGEALPNGTYFVVLRLGDAHILQNYVDLRR